jgi:DnaK suppressor protein
MLTEQERSRIREALVLEKQRLLRNAQEGLNFSMNRDRNIGRDSIDESMEEELFSTELRLRDREKWLLGKINGALERLEAGTIDECEECGEPIDYRRLIARPVTTLCIDCKEEREKEEQAQAVARGRAVGEALGEIADDSGAAGSPEERSHADE